MGIRYRRSVRLGSGARLNLGLRSADISFGTRGARLSFGTARSIATLGIPGTGLYATLGLGGKCGGRSSSSRNSRAGTTAVPVEVTPAMIAGYVPKPGLLASATEKRYREGVRAFLQGDHQASLSAFAAVSASDQKNASDDFFAALSANALGDNALAMEYLERVVSSNVSIPDQLMAKYLPASIFRLTADVSITERVRYQGPYDSTTALMMLAELYQGAGRREEAIGLIQQVLELVPESSAARLSLCDLLYDDDDFEGVVETAAGVSNRDNITLAVLQLRAKALANLGMVEQAVQQLSDCLRKTGGRDADLLRDIRYNRAEGLELMGQQSKARRDWKRIFAEDPSYRDVRQRLQAS